MNAKIELELENEIANQAAQELEKKYLLLTPGP